MSYTYAGRKKQGANAPHKDAAPAQTSLDALRTGAANPTTKQMGHRVDLPDAMRAKMENAFGADLSAVKLYESEAVADAGANAITQGSSIAFAPGMLDFTSYGGQALLGHELSHVVSQQRGEVTGGGFLNDHALEARADREGAMAAAGQQVAAPTAALSPISAAPAAGPMQAKKKKDAVPSPGPVSANHQDYANLEAGDLATRTAGYNAISQRTAANTTQEQRAALTDYVANSEPYNKMLRGNTEHPLYPTAPQDQANLVDNMAQIREAIGNNRIEEDTATYKGIEDSYFVTILQQAGLKKAVNPDGTVNHKWLESHQRQLRKALVGMTFSDPGFTSTTTERSFAQGWANKKNGMIRQQAFMDKHDMANMTPEEEAELERINTDRENLEGAHIIRMNLPAGSRAAAIDHAATEGRNFSGQSEILVDRGSQFRISGLQHTAKGRYDIIMDLLAAGGDETRLRR